MKLEEVNQQTREAVDFLVAALESGHSAVLTQYLAAMAKFRNYSFGNIMLIARQKPDATNVAGFRAWNSLGRFVRRGEKGISILAPMISNRRKNNASEEQTETPIRVSPGCSASGPCMCSTSPKPKAKIFPRSLKSAVTRAAIANGL